MLRLFYPKRDYFIMGLLSASLTDIGLKRSKNQDSIYSSNEEGLFIVADGMGGHAGGETASNLAVKTIPKYISENKSQTPNEASSDSVKKANQVILELGSKMPELKGMGTTVVQIYFKGPFAYVSNLGDSRSYLINKQQVYQITRDHSLIQEKINLRIYTREQAAADPNKNVLVRTCGLEENVDVDVFTYKVRKNDIFVLCSDGLHSRVSDSDILHIINKHIPDPKLANDKIIHQTVAALVAQANANGGNDNISVILIVAQ
ncbi:MAG: hypothetical protein CME68_03725 [Halobacteriovoraceae bacterium]|nr:hypothetical protein [Halobacteriovoraceae bacterium]